MLSDSVPDAPPNICPIVPEYDRDAPIVGVDVATVLTRPDDPTNAAPCDSDDRYRLDENVDDAVENRPFRNPIVVDVEL